MPGFCSRRLDVGLAEARHACGIEVREGLAEGLALAQDGDPGEPGLKAVEHELFPEGAAVAFGHAPLLIVIFPHQRI